MNQKEADWPTPQLQLILGKSLERENKVLILKREHLKSLVAHTLIEKCDHQRRTRAILWCSFIISDKGCVISIVLYKTHAIVA